MRSGSVWQALVQNGPVNAVVAAFNSLPFPFESLPIEIRGHTLSADSPDRFAYLLLQKIFRYDAFALDLIGNFLLPGQVAVDVGANIGLYALAMARAVGPAGEVVAVEPDPANHRLLRKNLEANACPQVAPILAMAAADRGEGTLWTSRSNRGDHLSFPEAGRAGIKVSRFPLDELAPAGRPVDFVKMDVQGYEAHVLAGMPCILARSPALRILAEFWPHGLDRAGSSPAAFLNALSASGFTFRIVDPSARKLVPADVESVLAAAPGKAYLELLCERGNR